MFQVTSAITIKTSQPSLDFNRNISQINYPSPTSVQLPLCRTYASQGTPDVPQCGFSMTVINILKIMNVNYKSINVLEDQNIRDGIKTYSEWPTIPQLYVKNEFVGGCDIIKEMYESGELAKFFDSKNIKFKKS